MEKCIFFSYNPTHFPFPENLATACAAKFAICQNPMDFLTTVHSFNLCVTPHPWGGDGVNGIHMQFACESFCACSAFFCVIFAMSCSPLSSWQQLAGGGAVGNRFELAGLAGSIPNKISFELVRYWASAAIRLPHEHLRSEQAADVLCRNGWIGPPLCWSRSQSTQAVAGVMLTSAEDGAEGLYVPVQTDPPAAEPTIRLPPF